MKTQKTIKTTKRFLEGPGIVETIHEVDALRLGIHAAQQVAVFQTPKGLSAFCWNDGHYCWVEICDAA